MLDHAKEANAALYKYPIQNTWKLEIIRHKLPGKFNTIDIETIIPV